MKVSIIILNYRGKKDTEECLASLALSSYSDVEIVVVDNASGDDSIAYLQKKFPNVTYIETKENLGYAGGNNVGIRYAIEKQFDAVLILNNDVILDRACVEGFVKSAQSYPEKILGGRVYQYYDKEKLQHLGGIWNKKRGKFISHPQDLSCIEEKWNSACPLDFIVGCALFIPVTVFQKIGLFEEAFFLHYEEIDFCIRANKAGFSCLYTPDAKLWHKESASFVNPRPPQMYFQTRNRLFFLKRNFTNREYYYWIITKFSYRFLLLLLKLGIKNIEYLALSLFYKKGITKNKQTARYAMKASLQGVFDYFRGKLGKGPSWIFYT